MRKTLLDKWNEIQTKIDEAGQKFIDEYFKTHPKFTKVYRLDSWSKISEHNIDRIYISTSKPRKPYFYGKRPTAIKLVELQEYFDTFNPTPDDIQLAYSFSDGTWKTSGAYGLKKIAEDERLAYCADVLIPLQNHLKELYEPREGYIPCTYCGKQIPEDTAVNYTVVARQYPGMKKTAKYCPGDCGVHDQMAHEG